MNAHETAIELIKTHPKRMQFETEEEAEAIRIEVSKVNENYIGCVEEVGVRKKVNGFREIPDKNGGRGKLVKTRWSWACVAAYEVWAQLDPRIEMDAILNHLKGWGREEGLDGMQIGNQHIDPNDDYDI